MSRNFIHKLQVTSEMLDDDWTETIASTLAGLAQAASIVTLVDIGNRVLATGRLMKVDGTFHSSMALMIYQSFGRPYVFPVESFISLEITIESGGLLTILQIDQDEEM